MPFFLTAPTDPGTGTGGPNPSGPLASWTAGSAAFPLVILDAGIATIGAGQPSAPPVTAAVPIDDVTIMFATIRGVPDATSFGVTITNSGGQLLISASGALPTLNQRVSWMIIGAPTP
jgi:hypothetical protein